MSAQELIDRLSETFLWETISAYIEQTRFLSEMLSNVGYLEDKDELLRKIDGTEILDLESMEISDCNAENGRISFGFEMPYILIAKSGKEQLLRISAAAVGKCSIPDENAFDWSAFDWENMNRPELLAHKDLVKFSELHFEDVECDDLTV